MQFISICPAVRVCHLRHRRSFMMRRNMRSSIDRVHRPLLIADRNRRMWSARNDFGPTSKTRPKSHSKTRLVPLINDVKVNLHHYLQRPLPAAAPKQSAFISRAAYRPQTHSPHFTCLLQYLCLISVDKTLRGRVSQNDKDRDKWRKFVHGVANPRIEDG